jgi:sugar transferase (PEP-CTERM system associated)
MKSDRFRLTPKTKLAVMAVDGFLFSVAVYVTFFFRLNGSLLEVIQSQAFWLIDFTLLSALYIFGAYDLDRDESYLPLIFRNAVSVVTAFFAAILLNYLLGTERAGLFGRGVLVGSMIIYYLGSLALRFFLWRYFHSLRAAVKILIFTDHEHKNFLEQEFQKNKFSGTWEWMLLDQKSGAKDHLWSELDQVRNQSWSAWVIAAPLNVVEKELGAKFLQARFSGTRIIDLSSFYEHTWRKIPVFHLGASWFFLGEGFSLVANRLRLRFKRFFDILLSALLLAVTWPLMLLTALAVKLESPGDVIYRQIRTGKEGLDFTIYKFRSMRKDAESKGAQWAQTNDARVTRVGKFIRLTRLDELPQLWNVLKGDMSFIGPRPERPEFNSELAQKIPYYNLRHLVRPGLTGWAQILYPYGASIEDAREKLQYDLYYIKNFTFLLDLQILLKTINVVVLGKGR